MQIENKKFWNVSKTLLMIRRNERCEELSSIWWVQTHEKSVNQIRGYYEGLGEVLMRKSVDLWWEHADITARKGKVVSQFPRP